MSVANFIQHAWRKKSTDHLRETVLFFSTNLSIFRKKNLVGISAPLVKIAKGIFFKLTL